MNKKWFRVIKVAVVRFATIYDPTPGWLSLTIALCCEIIPTALQKDEPNETDKTA